MRGDTDHQEVVVATGRCHSGGLETLPKMPFGAISPRGNSGANASVRAI